MIKIAVVSSKQFIARIIKFESLIPNIKLIPFLYDVPAEAAQIVEEISQVDGILFAGPLPYFIALDKVKEKKIPSTYITSDEYTLTHTLLFLMVNSPDVLGAISIDIHNEKFIQQVSKELHIPIDHWHIKDHSKKINNGMVIDDIEEIIRFHQHLWLTKQTKFAITNIDYVYEHLQKLGIPSTYLIVPDKAIADSITQLITYCELATSKSAEIAIGFVVFHQKEDDLQDFSTIRYDTSIILQQILLDLVRETETSIRMIGMDQFIIYGTRGSIEKILDEQKLNSLFRRMDHFPVISVSIGFGYGTTAKEAEEHGRIALYYAKKNSDKHQVFLTTSEKKIIGPYNAKPKTYVLKSEEKNVLELAELTQLAVSTISKLIQFMKLRQDKSFTSVELAEYLEVSRRSAERIIKKLMQQNRAEKVGEEQPYKQGRPRAIYKILF